MRIRLLGPVGLLRDNDEEVSLGGTMGRALLAALALRAGEPVSLSRLVDALWADDPPRTADATLRTYVSRLRRNLASVGLSLDTVPGGLCLRVGPEDIDVAVVEALAGSIGAGASPEDASAALARALGFWRGPSLGDLADRPFAVAHAVRLDEFRTSLFERRVVADLARGRHEAIAAELDHACETLPYREALWGSRMLALYRCGRQADALRAYGELRRRLVEDLGIEPSPPLRELEAAILNQARSLDHATPAVRDAGRAIPLIEGPPLVGRELERARLDQAWSDATDGRVIAVLLGGEPGIGKTRLALEVAHGVRSAGGQAVYGRAVDHDRPFGPILQALERLGERLPVEGLSARTFDVSERGEVFDAVVETLERIAGSTPLLLVLDDLQWAGPETLLLLRHVLGSSPAGGLLVVGTFRDTEVDGDHPLSALLRSPGVSVLPLGALDESAVGQLIDAPEDIARRLHGESGGNPFVAIEMGRQLRDPFASLPASVLDLIGGRCRQLGTGAHAVLRVASVVGKEFPVRLVEEVMRSDDPDLVLDSLDRAVRSRLLSDLGGGVFGFSHDLVRSALLAELTSARRARLHRGVAEVLAADPPDQQDLDALAHHSAEAVADGLPVRDAVDAALRCAKAGLVRLAPERSLAVLDQMLEVVSRTWRPDPAHRCDLLLAKSEVLEFAGQRDNLRDLALAAADDARAAGSADRLARCARRHFGWGEVGDTDATTVSLCEEALAALDPDAHRPRAEVLSVLAQVLSNGQGRANEAIAVADEAVEVARRSGDVDALLFALSALDRARLGHPEVERRLEINEQLVALASRAGDEAMRFSGIRQQAAVRLELGDIAGFEAEIQAMERLQPRLGSWISAFWTRSYRVTALLLAGGFTKAETILDEMAVDLADETNAVTMWAGMHALLRREQGRELEVVPLLDHAAVERPALTIFRVGAAAFLAEGGELIQSAERYEPLVAADLVALPRDQTLVVGAAGLTEAAVRLGDVDRGPLLRAVLDPYRGRLAVTGAGTLCFASVDRLIGMLFALEGRLDESVDAYQRALQLETSIGAAPFSARTRRWLGEVLLTRGRPDDIDRAAVELEDAHAEAVRLGMARLEAELVPLRAAAAHPG